MNYQYTEPSMGGESFAFAHQPTQAVQAYPRPTAPFDPYTYPSYGSPAVDTTSVALDLLDAPLPYGVPPQIITMPVTASSSTTLVASEPNNLEDDSLVTPELVAAQQRILDDIRRRQQQNQSDEAMARGISTSAVLVEQRRYDANNRCRALVIPGPGMYDPSPVVHPQKSQMKQSRPYKTALGATGGAVAGGLMLAPVFPLGMVLGGVAGGVATQKACKAGEKRAQCKWEQESFQQGTETSPLARHGHLQEEGSGLV